MSVKRVVQITNNFTPYNGGVTRAIQTLTRGLRDAGIQNTIITLDFTGESYSDENDVIRLPTVCKITCKNNPLAYPLNSSLKLFNILQKLKPDLIHLHHPFLLGNSGLRCAQQLNIPTLFTYHTLYHTYTHYVPLPSWITQQLIHYRLKKFCAQVNGIITPSTAAYDIIASLGYANKTETLPSPVQKHFLLTERPLKSISYPIELLCVSRFVQEKNLTALLELLKRLPAQQFRLTLAGYGYLENSLKRLAYGTYQFSPEQVRFTLHPTQDELVQLYRTAHFFLFPSQTDTQGLVLAEAMAQGLPVIALRGPGQADLVKTGYNGAMVSSISEMAEHVVSICKNPTLYTQLARNAYASHTSYHPTVYTQKILTLYEKSIAVVHSK